MEYSRFHHIESRSFAAWLQGAAHCQIAYRNARSRWHSRVRSQRAHAVMDKGGHQRLDHRRAEHHSLIFRSIKRGAGIIGNCMTAQSSLAVVRVTGDDLRRTFANLPALEQIQLSVGHASITTAERYLGVRRDITDASCDHLGLKIKLPARTRRWELSTVGEGDQVI